MVRVHQTTWGDGKILPRQGYDEVFFWGGGGGGALSLHRGGGRSLSKPYQYLTPPVVSTCY